MEQHETSPKPRKRRSRVGIVLLIILLLLAGAAGYLYYSVVKAPLALDDPQKLAASAPMSAEERFRFFPADRTVQVKLDTGDIWSLLLAHAGPDFMDAINAELAPYSLTVSGCAIHMDENGPWADLELFYGDTRLVAKVPCTLEISGRHISLAPTEVKLGAIPLPVGSLLSAVKLEYDLDLPVISQVTQVEFAQDALLLTGPLDIHALLPSNQELYWAAVFCESLQPLVDALGSDEGYTALLSRLEQEPGSLEAIYRQLFTLADGETTNGYLDSRFGLTQRFFPGIDFSAVEADRIAMDEKRVPLTSLLEKFFTMVVNDYNEKQFRLSGGAFLKYGVPFQAAQYGGRAYDALFEVLASDDFFLVLVDVEDGFIRKTSSFYRMADEEQQFTQEVDFNKTYILGCVLRSVDGNPFLLYETEVQNNNSYSRSITLCPLTEADVEALQVPEKFGVWTG